LVEEKSPPTAKKPEEKDDWARALDSLESEFVQSSSVSDEGGKGEGSGWDLGGSGAPVSSAKALLATQDLQLEVDRLRDELGVQEEALSILDKLDLKGSDLYGPSAPDDSRAARRKVEELEQSLQTARRQAANQSTAVEDLRLQLAGAQEQLKAALSALASQIPQINPEAGEEAPARVAPVHAGLSFGGRRIIRRSPQGTVGPGGLPDVLTPVEVRGPDGEQVASVVFAGGEGEALELFLSTLFQQWKGLGRNVEARIAADGLHLTLTDDPENRRMSILASGTYVIHVGGSEASRIRSLLAARTGGGKGGP
jgi:hypothetical protein